MKKKLNETVVVTENEVKKEIRRIHNQNHKLREMGFNEFEFSVKRKKINEKIPELNQKQKKLLDSFKQEINTAIFFTGKKYVFSREDLNEFSNYAKQRMNQLIVLLIKKNPNPSKQDLKNFFNKRIDFFAKNFITQEKIAVQLNLNKTEAGFLASFRKEMSFLVNQTQTKITQKAE